MCYFGKVVSPNFHLERKIFLKHPDVLLKTSVCFTKNVRMF